MLLGPSKRRKRLRENSEVICCNLACLLATDLLVLFRLVICAVPKKSNGGLSTIPGIAPHEYVEAWGSDLQNSHDENSYLVKQVKRDSHQQHIDYVRGRGEKSGGDADGQ